MPLPLPPNAAVDLYRGFDVLSPYPPSGIAPVFAGVPGHLRPHAQNGRFGFNALNLHWTHLLYLDLAVDVRDPYDDQLAAADTATADTVLIPDYPILGACTAFSVVLVQRRTTRLAGSFQAVYLDRLAPRQGGCLVPAVNDGCGGCVACPQKWQVTLAGVTAAACANCGVLNRTWTMTYQGGCLWQDTIADTCGGGPGFASLHDQGTGTWQFAFGFAQTAATYQQTYANWKCYGPNTLNFQNSGLICATVPASVTVVPA